MNDAPRASGSEQPYRGPDIERLLALLENAREGSRELDVAVCRAAFAYTEDVWYSDHYTTSLDAAVSLVPKHERGGWFWRAGSGSVFPGWAHLNKYHPDHCDRGDEITARAATPPLAICIAALKARAPLLKSVPSLSPTLDRGAPSPESSLPESNNQSETP